MRKIALLSIVLAVATVAYGNTIQYNHMGVSTNIVLHYGPSPYDGDTIPAGEIFITYTDTSGASTLSVFCIDAGGNLPGAAYAVDSVTPAAYAGVAGQKAGWLYKTYFSASMGGVNAAGLQVAIWEVMHEDDNNSYDAASGDMSISNVGGNDVISSANSYLATLSSYTPVAGVTVLDDASMSGRQAVMMVPEPVTVLLLGLGGLLLIKTSKRSIHHD